MKTDAFHIANLIENQSNLYEFTTFTDENKSSLEIYYSLIETRYGKALIANSAKGICYIAFGNKERVLKELTDLFPCANIQEQEHKLQEVARLLINNNYHSNRPLPLHLKGTAFQLKVWEALLHIPPGQTTSYQNIALFIGKENSNRAVGSAVGKNPISCLIPCHRVVRANGNVGEYHWGVELKQKMIATEANDII